MDRNVKYPIGEQSFKILREGGYLYVDKTRFIEKIVNSGQYFFLGRPRRFGKSLFLSTLKYFFEGKRELFKGLYADSMDWKWEEYPVIHLDLNTQRFSDEKDLDHMLENFLHNLEVRFQLDYIPESYSQRFANIIRTAAQKTGKNVVVLVDEYDKPLVNNLHNRRRFESFRSRLAEIYSNFKSSADYIRFVFLTGVSRFGKLSVFSDLNNINDISFDEKYSAICGITEQELTDNFKIGIEELALKHKISEEQVIVQLKEWYDGYHFSISSPDIYNPFSLLNTFSKGAFENYWIATGTPSLLLEQLKRTNYDLRKLTDAKGSLNDLAGLDIDNMYPVALFYQTGYLTIKGYNPRRQLYTLGLPNREVTEGFYEYILPAYGHLRDESSKVFIADLIDMIEDGDVDGFMKQLRSLFAGTGYEMRLDEERNVQNVLLIVFKLIGLSVEAEYSTSDGRIDILMRTDRYVYIIELKYDRSPEEALAQIENKGYALPWSTDSRQTIAIAINFDTKKRNLDWLWKTL